MAAQCAWPVAFPAFTGAALVKPIRRKRELRVPSSINAVSFSSRTHAFAQPNINVIRSVWRRTKKGHIKVRDLQPEKDVKGGGGVTGNSSPTKSGTGSH
jgi:hypothetical protein